MSVLPKLGISYGCHFDPNPAATEVREYDRTPGMTQELQTIPFYIGLRAPSSP